MKLKKLFTLILLAFFSFSTFSQESKDEESETAVPVARFQSFMENLTPEEAKERRRLMYESQKEYLKIRIEIMSEPETAELLATFSKAYFDALVKSGFSSEQAMQLVTSVGIPRLQ